ncbi:MAG TPA: peptide deformylase [Elusimicrobia bacterium]|nr:MAG: peptide deformylase [Elusimicrobia bacterium RIFOXYA2_FULL_69_6]HAH07309.1 peptide deformylase [Elusimicrobiota bacterium]
MLLQVARLGNPVLRKKAKAFTPEGARAAETQRLIEDMIETMREQDGAGLAAPQVHVSKRLVVIETREPNPRYPGEPRVPLTVLINPELTRRSREMAEDWEGCLSLPDWRGLVPRHQAVAGKALDRQGRVIEFEAEGFSARVIQHELDHLDGIVFIDRMKDFSSLGYCSELNRRSQED